MSRTIDERVVEMQFQNDQFERGIKQSTKSLKNLKDSLKLDDSTESTRKLGKAFDDLSSVSLSGLDTALRTAERGFSAFETIATSALATVTSQVTSYATNIAKSLSIDQVTEGFTKYEKIIGSTKTIMAATEKTADEVGEKLDKLNWFTDETSYNMSDMTNNVGKFTSAGIDLNESVDAMMGIANWAAVSGQNASAAARAMYNISQAISVGSMKLMDWRSIENANMATQEFKQTAIDTAIAMGKLVTVNGKVMTSDKKMTVTAQNFSDTLSKQWFTSDVLIATLRKYSDYTNQVYDLCQTEGILASEAMDRLSDSTDELGKKSFEAAQQSKTFKDALDATKDAVSSQWMHTFQYVFGNIDEAIDLWTKVTEVLWDVFAASGETRNEILKFWHDNGGRSSLLSSFQNLYDIISAIASIADQAFKTIIPPMTGERLVELMQGFENLTLRIKQALGFVAEFKVSVQEALDAVTGADGRAPKSEMLSSTAQADAEAAQKIYESMPNWMKQWADKNGEVNLPIVRDWTRQINFDTWAKYQAAKLGIPIDPIAKQYDAYNQLNSTAQARIREGKKRDYADGKTWSAGYLAAWNAYWDAADAVEAAMSGTAITAEGTAQSIEKVTEATDDSTASAYSSLTIYEKLTKIVRGFAAAIDIVKQALSAIGYGVIQLIPALKPLVDVFTDILAEIADWIVGQDEALKQSETFKNGMDAIVGFLKPIIQGLADTIRFLWESFKGIRSAIKDSELFKAFTERIGDFWNAIKEIVKGIQGSDIWKSFPQFFQQIVDAIKGFFSADTSGLGTFEEKLVERLSSFAEFGTWVTNLFMSEGWGKLGEVLLKIFNPLKGVLTFVFNLISDLLTGLENVTITDIWKTLQIAAFIGALIKVGKSILDVTGLFGTVKKSVKTISESLSEFFENLGDKFKKKKEQIPTAVLKIAVSIGILAYAFSKLAMLNSEQITAGIVALGAIMGELLAFMFVTQKIEKSANGIGTKGIVKVAIAVALFARSLEKLSNLSGDRIFKGLGAMLGILTELEVFMFASNKFGSGAKGLISLSIAIGAMTLALTALSNLSGDQIFKGLGAMLGILTELEVFMFASNKFGSGAKGLISLSIAIGAMTLALTALSNLSGDQIFKGLGAMLGILTELEVFMFASNKFGSGAKGLISLSIAIGAMALALYNLGKLDDGELRNGIIGLTACVGLIAAFVRICSNITKAKPITMLLSMVGLAAVMLAFGLALKLVAQIPWQTIATFSVGLSAVVLAFANAMSILTNVPFVSGLKAIGLLSVAVLALGAVFGLVLDLVSGSVSSALVQLSSALELAGGMISGFSRAMDGISSSRVEELKGIFGTLFGIVASVPVLNDGTALIAFSGNLSQLGAALGLFITNSDGVTPEAVSPRVSAIESLLDILASVSAMKIANVQDFVGYITDLGGALTLFAGVDSGLGGEEVSARVQNATDMLETLVENLPSNLTTTLGSLPEENAMSQFSARLVSLGGALVSFGESASGIDRDDVNSAIISLGMLGELETALKNHGGIFEQITGISSLDTFSASVADIGGGLAAFADKTSTIDSDKVTNAIGALRMMSTLEWGLRNHGSLFKYFTGEASLSNFATGVNAIGQGLYNFAEKTKSINSDKVTNAANALSVFAAIDRSLINHGGVLSWFTGDQDLSDLGNNLRPLGAGLAAFCDELKDVKNTTAASQAATILQKLAVADTNLNLAGSVLQLQTFASSLHDGKGGGIGEKMKAFSDDLSGFDSKLVGSVTNTLTDLSLIDSNALEALGLKFKDGIFSASVMTSITTGIVSMFSTMTTELRNHYSDFYSAGEYLDTGLANGIIGGTWRVINASRYVGNKAVSATRQAMAIHSPSRIGEELGRYWDMGIANGMTYYTGLVEDAAFGISDAAVGTAQGIVAKVSEIMASDMSLAPTITPVLDASSIRSGIGGINGLFGNRTISLNGVNTVNLSDRTPQAVFDQNGSNYTGIVNAINSVNSRIDALGEKLARMQIVLDSGALVGQIAGDIDKTLGERTIMKGRGN